MEDQKPKMESHHWFQLYLAASFFTFIGWIAFIPDIFLAGYVGRLVDLFAAMTFALWFMIWKDKDIVTIGTLTAIVIGFTIGEAILFIPWVGDIGDLIPKWIGLIYLFQKNYGKSVLGAVTAPVAGKLNQKIAGSNMSERKRFLAEQAVKISLAANEGRRFSEIAKNVGIDSLNKHRTNKTQNPTTNNLAPTPAAI